MKHWMQLTAMCLIIAGLWTALFFVNRSEKAARANIICRDISITFADNYRFVTENDIRMYIARHFKDWDKIPADSLNLSEMEKTLDLQSAVRKSDVYFTSDGTLNVIITQREPVIRFQKGDMGFYVDGGGFIFPMQGSPVQGVPTICGEIPLDLPDGFKGKIEEKTDLKWMDNVLNMIAYLNKHKKWGNNISQISVAQNGDFCFVLHEGEEIFNIGEPVEIDNKFSKIEKYYQYIEPLDKEYTSVNVKYKRQIICK